MSFRSLLLFFPLALLTAGCNNVAHSNKASTNAAHSELGILPKLISLPRRPISVKWELSDPNNPGTGSLRALLEFSDADKIFIVKSSAGFGRRSNDRINASLYEGWLPPQAKAKLRARRDGGMYELLGIAPLRPDLFAKVGESPYVSGTVTPLANGYILVSLYAT